MNENIIIHVKIGRYADVHGVVRPYFVQVTTALRQNSQIELKYHRENHLIIE